MVASVRAQQGDGTAKIAAFCGQYGKRLLMKMMQVVVGMMVRARKRSGQRSDTPLARWPPVHTSASAALPDWDSPNKESS